MSVKLRMEAVNIRVVILYNPTYVPVVKVTHWVKMEEIATVSTTTYMCRGYALVCYTVLLCPK